MSTPTPVRYIPLDAAETTVLKDNLTLLPQEVYRQLAEFIDEALDKVPTNAVPPDINEVRSHNAVSVDGDRGTGKTSVLVNLETWLAHEPEYKDKLQRIHILKPIDPTLLEENESLFLHIIVAAVLSDKKVKEAQKASPESMKALNKSLESLAFALESVKKQNADYGMDRLRSLFGNQRLAECVQDFFRETLRILGKDLLVLPIDDVDTSLHRAFENLEIVRRYLVTPYVLPIVSGDRALYDEVTWRDFHQRLTKDSGYKPELAFDKAVELAQEYQRKLLPLPRRLEMPPVSKYLHDNNTQLKNGAENVILLSSFYSWLEIFISGPVNGLEGSQLELPIPSIRALTQLINKCGKLIPKLPSAFRHAQNALQVQRAWQMPEVSNEAICAFEREYRAQQAAENRGYSIAYKRFSEQQRRLPASGEARMKDDDLLKWEKTLHDYFRYEGKAGAVTLVLLASQHWQAFRDDNAIKQGGSLFDTPLFQPLRHENREFVPFVKTEDLVEWSERLSGRLPESWLNSLASRRTILPYPLPEVGVSTRNGWRYWNDIPEKLQGTESRERIIFLSSLTTHYNFYTASKQSVLLNIGRIFEIIISSLVGNVSFEDLERISQSAPFFSASALAPSKTLTTDAEKDDEQEINPFLYKRDYDELKKSIKTGVSNRPSEVAEIIEKKLGDLQREINEWRNTHNINAVRFSPWMVYKVFNKVYSQVANSEYFSNVDKDLNKGFVLAGGIFYSIWSAFGSFEKGRVFGLPEVVATSNLGSPKNFEVNNDHFNLNLSAFAVRENEDSREKEEYGKLTRTASYYLTDHPIRIWFEDAMAALSAAQKSATEENTSNEQSTDSRVWLREQLKLPEGARLTDKAILQALAKLTSAGVDESELLRNMEEIFPRRVLTGRLRRLIDEKKAAK